MKKLLNVVILVLALNFLAAAGAAGYGVKNYLLNKEGKLDREKIAAIKNILSPPPAQITAATQPASDPTTQPFFKLEELLAEKAGLPVGQQVEYLQQMADAKMAELDRRQRELLALKDQVERAQRELDAGRGQLLKDEQAVTERADEAAKLAADKGFQDALKLYNSMPAKNVKQIFASLDDETVVRFVKAMEPRAAAKILKEFKSPDELARAQRYLERLRQAPPATLPATAQPGDGAPQAGARPTLPQATAGGTKG
jgi:flagellar motility protein MotE (MotC chaperone)